MTSGKAARPTVRASTVRLKEVTFPTNVRRFGRHVFDDVVAVPTFFSKFTATLICIAIVTVRTEHLGERDEGRPWTVLVLASLLGSFWWRRLQIIRISTGCLPLRCWGRLCSNQVPEIGIKRKINPPLTTALFSLSIYMIYNDLCAYVDFMGSYSGFIAATPGGNADTGLDTSLLQAAPDSVCSNSAILSYKR